MTLDTHDTNKQQANQQSNLLPYNKEILQRLNDRQKPFLQQCKPFDDFIKQFDDAQKRFLR